MKQPPSSTQEESATTGSPSQSKLPRIVGALLVVTGVVHLLKPTTLLGLAERGYGTVFDVEFDPNSGASTRVRALGLGLIAAGAHLVYYGAIKPTSD